MAVVAAKSDPWVDKWSPPTGVEARPGRVVAQALISGHLSPVQEGAARVPGRAGAAVGDRRQRFQHHPVGRGTRSRRRGRTAATPRPRRRRPPAVRRQTRRTASSSSRRGEARRARACRCRAPCPGRPRRRRPTGTPRRSRRSRSRTPRSGTSSRPRATISVISYDRMPCSAIQSSVSGPGPVAAQPDLQEPVAAGGARLDQPAHRLAVPEQRAELAVAGVGVRVEVQHRDPAEAVARGPRR